MNINMNLKLPSLTKYVKTAIINSSEIKMPITESSEEE
jgi:hypothetical protein